MLQSAWSGAPGQMGQVSPAAASQTVITRSSGGASGAAKASQLLLVSPAVSWPSSRNIRIASGCTAPLGRLPAENTTYAPRPSRVSRHSARMLLAELPVHRKRTRQGRPSMARGSAGSAAAAGAAGAFGFLRRRNDRSFARAASVLRRQPRGVECLPGDSGRVADPGLLRLGVAAGDGALLE